MLRGRPGNAVGDGRADVNRIGVERGQHDETEGTEGKECESDR